MTEIPVDLTKTGGKLVPPGASQLKTEHPPTAPQPHAVPPKPVPKTEQSKEEDHKHEAGKNCRYCGWDQSTDPAQPTADERTAFHQSVWTGTAYERSYDFFEGAASVTFRMISAVQEQKIGQTATKVAFSGELKDIMSVMARSADLASDARFGLSVVELRLGDKVTKFAEPEDVLVAADAVRAAVGGGPVYQVVRAAYERFVAVLGSLMSKEATKPSFSPATRPYGDSQGSPVQANRR